MEFEIGDKVILPFEEKGILEDIKDNIWGFNYIVKITHSVFNNIGEYQDFKYSQLTKDICQQDTQQEF